MSSKYCYPDSDVLINKFDIRDAEALHALERDITYKRSVYLAKYPLPNVHDFSHLKAIHKYMFGDIYSFAGKIRDVDIAKSNLFCKPVYIEDQARFIFGKLEKDNFLKGLSKEPFVSKLADYMADINALHPFREGNGRTLRMFVSSMAKEAGYDINFAGMNKDELLKADITGMRGDTRLLKELLSSHCSDLYLEIGKRIDAGLAGPEEISRFNEIQEQRYNRSMNVAKEESQAMSLSSPDLTR